MSTSPEEEKKVSTNPDEQTTEHYFTTEFFANFKIGLPIGENNSPVEVHLFSNPKFNEAVRLYLEKQHSHAEWNFLQDIYKASLSSPENSQKHAEELLQKYIVGPEKSKTDENQVNFAATVIKEIKENVKNQKGLDSFAPAMPAMNELLNNLLPLGSDRPLQQKTYLDAYQQDQHDKLMLPIRTVICSALEEIEKIISKTPKPGFFEKPKPEIAKMKMIQNQLIELLKSSTQRGYTTTSMQKLLTKLAIGTEFLEDNKALAGKLGSESPRTQRVGAFVDLLAKIHQDNAALNSQDPTTFETTANKKLIEKYMLPIEKQMQEKPELERKDTSIRRGPSPS